ncbi:MAG: hypothetical protein U9Q17_03735, partial [Chloroflexota bacterium]|nr:hypothetical protein [Chloroflexota bacterium]
EEPKERLVLHGPRGGNLLPQTKKRKGEHVWLRLGDVAEYEKFNDPCEAGKAVGARLAHRPEEHHVLSLYYRRAGVEIEPYYTGRNYISLFWGDEEAQWIRDLSNIEKRKFEREIEGELGFLPTTRATLPTREEWHEAEGMWQVTKEDAEKGEVSGVYLWGLVNKYYPGDRNKQIRLMGFMNEVQRRYPSGHVSREEAWEIARKWEVEKMLTAELVGFLPRVEEIRQKGRYGRKAERSANSKSLPTRSDVSVKSWSERDRLGIWIEDNRTGETVAEWWDDNARQMFEQGFFKPGDVRHQEITGRAFEESILDYAESVGLLANGKHLAQTVRDAYYWTAVSKDTGEITESHVPYTSPGRALRGGKSFVSWHWRGEALVEVWRQPHRYSEGLKIEPVTSERMALGKSPAGTPTEGKPTGTCYADAWRFLIKEEEGELIHGTVFSGGRRIGHAWVETSTGWVWEPETGRYFTRLGFRNAFAPVVESRYTAEEAAIMAARTKNLGPWSEQERLQYLKGKSPAIIPKHPQQPRLKDKLEFLPDSPEFLAYTIDDIGYRDKIDTAFWSAIARARGGK